MAHPTRLQYFSLAERYASLQVYNIKAMSAKDRGNQCFKDRQYQEAIRHYQQYLEEEHPDNKNAWFNLSLCHSKLSQPKQSIEAAQTAKEIDSSYAKCYYRLANQYQKIKGKEYDVFVNAVQFQKLANEKQSQEKREMHQLALSHKKYLTTRAKKQEKTSVLTQLVDQCQTLDEKEDNEERIEVDKYLEEWLVEWNQGTQSEEAKWCEIQYIAEQIDYDFGINLGNFYLNQLKTSEQKKKIRESIKELIARLKREKQIDFDELGIENMEKRTSKEAIESDDSSQNLFQDMEPPIQQTKAQQSTNSATKPKAQQQTETLEPKKSQEVSKTPQTIQEKLQEKKNKMQQMQHHENTQKPEKPEATKTKKEDKQQSIKVSPKPQPQSTTKKEQSKSEQQIEEMYDIYCGELSKSKDVFKQTYKCVLKILEDKKESSQTKGKLLVLLRKRGKKFKFVMESTSQNEQLVVFDLLRRNKMEQYAVDLAPKYYKM